MLIRSTELFGRKREGTAMVGVCLYFVFKHHEILHRWKSLLHKVLIVDAIGYVLGLTEVFTFTVIVVRRI